MHCRSLPRWPGWWLLLQKGGLGLGRGCIRPSKEHRIYFKGENPKSPRKTIQISPFPSSLLDTLGR